MHFYEKNSKICTFFKDAPQLFKVKKIRSTHRGGAEWIDVGFQDAIAQRTVAANHVRGIVTEQGAKKNCFFLINSYKSDLL